MQWLDQAPEGLRLPVTTPLDEVETAAREAEVIVLEFDAFRDGRGFSLASVLRERGFTGRLVADGRLIPDQARHLRRTGFDAVVVGPNGDQAAWRRMDAAFSAAYQPAEDPSVPIWRRGRTAAPRPEPRDEAEAAPDAEPASVESLNASAPDETAEAIVRAALAKPGGLRPAVLSSFGAEAAALLSIVAKIDPTTPVIFLDTGMHFLQTLSYRKRLAEHFGLTDVRIVTPDPAERALEDARDSLWRSDPDACCDLRKVRPLDRALADVDLLITGRKRFQTADRAEMRAFEAFDGRIRANPLMNWTAEDVEAAFEDEDLPRHPLTDQGYPSIGCWPCTRPVEANDDARAGRWAGSAKTECGIHLARRTAASR